MEASCIPCKYITCRVCLVIDKLKFNQSIFTCTIDSYLVSWLHVSNRIFSQLFYMGETQQWSRAIYNNVKAAMLMALHLLSIGFPRLLLWIS